MRITHLHLSTSYANQTRQNDLKEIANLEDEESVHVYFHHHHRQSSDHTA